MSNFVRSADQKNSESLASEAQSEAMADLATERQVDEFRDLLERLALLIQSENVATRAYESRDLPWFRRLSGDEKLRVYQTVSTYYEVMDGVKREDQYVLRNPNALWRMLSRLRFVPCDDVFSSIDGDDFLELYDTQNRQIFCSFNVFGVCSYTLEDLYTRPWPELYTRTEEVMAAYFAAMTLVSSPETFGTHQLDMIPTHLVIENKAPLRFVTLCRPKIGSAIRFSSGEFAGFVHAFEVLEHRAETIPEK